MKQMINEIQLQGYVYSIGGRDGALYHGRTSAESKIPNTDYVSGTVNIVTDEDGANIVPIRFNFVTEKYSKSGKENPSWGVLRDIENNNATWQAQGKEGAYKIRVTCAAASNPFVGQEGRMVDRPTIDVTFAHPAAGGFNDNQRNAFKFDMIVVNYSEHEVEDGENYGVINGYVFNSFRKEATPVVLTIHDPSGMQYFESLDASTGNPVFQSVWGKIVSTTIRHEKEVESAFGAPQIEYTTSTQREWVVEGCAANVGEFGDAGIISEDELVECLNNHENTIALAKERYENSHKPASAFDAPNIGGAAKPKRTFGSSSDFAF